MIANSEKRKFARTPVQLNVECSEIDAGSGNILHLSSVNISLGGIFLETEKPLKPGAKLNMKIKLANNKLDLQATGTVMWFCNSSKENPSGAGISLEFPSDIAKKQLESFIIQELANKL